MLGDPITDLTIAMEVNYFQLNQRRVLRAGGGEDSGQRAGAGAQAGGARAHADRLHRRDEGRLRHHDAERARQGRYQAERRDGARSSRKRPIQYDTGFTLLPGNYTIKLLARDDETGRIGTFMTQVRRCRI